MGINKATWQKLRAEARDTRMQAAELAERLTEPSYFGGDIEVGMGPVAARLSIASDYESAADDLREAATFLEQRAKDMRRRARLCEAKRKTA